MSGYTSGPQPLSIYGDESSHRGGHKYLVYGTMSCDSRRVPAVLKKLERSLGDKRFERKWNDKRFLDHYLRFVDAIFECRDKHYLTYRCIVVNTRHAQHAKYNNNDPDLGLEKYIFLHLLDYARRQKVREARFFVYLDKRTTKYNAATQKRTLNRRDKIEHGRAYDIFEDVQDVDSKSLLLIQAADVLSGAIAWVMNERYLAPDSSHHKKTLATHIAKRAKLEGVGHAAKIGIKRGELKTLAYPTWPHKEAQRIAIWHLNLRKEKELEMRSLSKAQLACFPKTMTFGEVAARGYTVSMNCPRCDRTRKDILTVVPAFGHRAVKDRFRPPCSACGQRGCVLLKPDPLAGRLLAEMRLERK